MLEVFEGGEVRGPMVTCSCSMTLLWHVKMRLLTLSVVKSVAVMAGIEY